MRKQLVSTNPGKNYEEIGKVAVSSEDEIRSAVKSAHRAASDWKDRGVDKRIEILRKLYKKFVNTQEVFKKLEITEIGKTIKNADSMYVRFLHDFEWFMDNGSKAISDEVTFEDTVSKHTIVYEPYGVAGVIAPWNHPFGNFVWGVIPNLITGNVVVFKHSEECPLAGKLIDKIINKSLPDGVFTQIYGDGHEGSLLLEQDINLIWFTGSTKTGQAIYKKAGEKFIKAVLEMGGSNPGIVFEDADIEKFTQKFYLKRFNNCGQACDALKRLIVHKNIFKNVVDRLKAELKTKNVGENDNPKTDIGSLVAKRQLLLLEEQVADAVEKGAKVIFGGKRPAGLKGAYYEPTILTNIIRNMRVWNEEVFGPVLVVIPFETEEDAIKLANETQYGLGSLVFTKDKKRARRVASQLKTGTVEINGGNHWITCNPFGGYKYSGMGREHGIAGLRELCQIKVVSEEK